MIKIIKMNRSCMRRDIEERALEIALHEVWAQVELILIVVDILEGEDHCIFT
jgi:hypothetical protein